MPPRTANIALVNSASEAPTPAPETQASPVFLVTLGRGNSGKSTGAAEAIWRARAAGRSVVVVDADKRSQTLRRLFPDAIYPETEELEDVKSAITRALDEVIKNNASVVFDFGTQDRPLLEYSRDMDLLSFCADVGMTPVVANYVGPSLDDLNHVHSLWQTGFFRPDNALLFLNEGVIRQGKTVAGAFERVMASDMLAEMTRAGVHPILLHRLATMDRIMDQNASLYDAIKPESTMLGPTEKHMTRQWVARLDERRKSVLQYLP